MNSGDRPARRMPPRPTLQLGETIRDRREERHLSMQAAADQAGISAGYQFKLEGGFVRTPSPRVLHRLGSVLGLQYQELMRLAGYPLELEIPGAPAPAPVRRIDAGVGGASPGDTDAELAPTNRRIILLLEEIRRDVAALRAGLLNP